jgi:hypothetical protein
MRVVDIMTSPKNGAQIVLRRIPLLPLRNHAGRREVKGRNRNAYADLVPQRRMGKEPKADAKE